MIELLVEATLRSWFLGATVGLLLAVSRIRDAGFHHTCWKFVLAAVLVMPLLVWQLPALELPLFPASEPAPTSLEMALVLSDSVLGGTGALEPAPPAPSSGWPWMAIYAAIALVLALRVGIGYALGLRLVHSGKPVPLSVLPQAMPKVRYLTAQRVLVPMTFGWVRPVVLLPGDFDTWSRSKLASVLDHEHAHITRRDFPTTIAASLIRAAHWLNPMTWWIEWRLRTLAERAADDMAAGEDPTGYAEVLLGLAGASGTHRVRVLAMADSRGLASRINRLLDTRYRTMLRPKPFLLPLALLAGIVLIGIASMVEITEATPVSRQVLQSVPAFLLSPPIPPAPPSPPPPPASPPPPAPPSPPIAFLQQFPEPPEPPAPPKPPAPPSPPDFEDFEFGFDFDPGDFDFDFDFDQDDFQFDFDWDEFEFNFDFDPEDFDFEFEFDPEDFQFDSEAMERAYEQALEAYELASSGGFVSEQTAEVVERAWETAREQFERAGREGALEIQERLREVQQNLERLNREDLARMRAELEQSRSEVRRRLNEQRLGRTRERAARASEAARRVQDALAQAFRAQSRPRTANVYSDGEPGVRAPRILSRQTPPRCTRQAVFDEVDGTILVQAIVRRSGDLEIHRIIPDPDVSEEMIARVVSTIRGWEYRPGTVNGRPADVLMNIEVDVDCR